MAKYILYSALLGLAMQAAFVSAARPDFITDDIMAMVADDKGRCMSEHGTTEALIDQVNQGTLPNDRALTCYMNCLFSAFGIIEDGDLEVEMLVGFLPDHMQADAQTVIGGCANEKGDSSDVCDIVYNVAKCIQAKRPDLWFMI